MNIPQIAVIIPLYNKEPIIERTIKSVLNQSYSDFELIIVNDGSTDNSVDVVRRFEDDRIVLLEQENAGPSAARNVGIKRAKAEWIVFIDADDELLPDALKLFMDASKKSPKCQMFCGEILIQNQMSTHLAIHYSEGEDANPYKRYVLGEFSQCSGSTMYSRNLCLQCMYNEKFRRYEDLDCLFRKYQYSNIYFIPHPVACVNINYASASSARKRIKEDFLGYLNFKGKSFWERMALYKFYLGERDYYQDEVRELYPNLHRRYDLLLLYKCILLLKRIHVM